MQGKNAPAEDLYVRALRTQRRVLGPEYPDVANTAQNLATLYVNEDRSALAEPLAKEAMDIRRRVLGEQHAETLRSMTTTGQILLNTGRPADAESLLRTALAGYESTKADGWERYNCQSLLGASLAAQERYPDAETLVVSAFSALKEREASIPRESRIAVERAGSRVVRLYTEWGKRSKRRSGARRSSVRDKAGLPSTGLRPGKTRLYAKTCASVHRRRIRYAELLQI